MHKPFRLLYILHTSKVILKKMHLQICIFFNAFGVDVALDLFATFVFDMMIDGLKFYSWFSFSQNFKIVVGTTSKMYL